MIKIYTDGSSIGNPGPWWWAILVLHDDKKKAWWNAGTLLETDPLWTVPNDDAIDENQLSELKNMQPIGRGHVVGMPESALVIDEKETEQQLEINAQKKPQSAKWNIISVSQSLFPTEDARENHTLENAIQKTHTSVGKAVSIAWKEDHTTNNRMELTAVISALLYIQQETFFDKHVVLYMDSTYVHDWLDSYLAQRIARWRRLANKKPVQNIDLRKQLSKLKGDIEAAMAISWWNLQRARVKAHRTDKYNNLVDILAREQAEG